MQKGWQWLKRRELHNFSPLACAKDRFQGCSILIESRSTANYAHIAKKEFISAKAPTGCENSSPAVEPLKIAEDVPRLRGATSSCSQY